MGYFSVNGSWVVTNPYGNPEDLIRRMYDADLMISDFDETDAPSPAKRIAYKSLLTPSYWSSRYLPWVFLTGFDLLLHGKGVESEAWYKFLRLIPPKELERIKQEYTMEYARKRLYDGVPDFYQILPNSKKVSMSRGIREFLEGFGKVLGSEIKERSFDKRETTKTILRENPGKTRVILRGDSAEDRESATYLIDKKGRRELDDVVTVNVVKSRKDVDPFYDINTSRNHTALVSLMRGLLPMPL